MSHGGKREGAGRKAQLSYQQAISVGLWCERLWDRAAEVKWRERYEARTATQQVRAAQARAQAIPVKLRRTAVSRQTLEEISDDIDFATKGDRFVSVPVANAYGLTKVVLGAAVRRCGKTYGIAITERKARECWEQARALEARLREATQNYVPDINNAR